MQVILSESVRSLSWCSTWWVMTRSYWPCCAPMRMRTRRIGRSDC